MDINDIDCTKVVSKKEIRKFRKTRLLPFNFL